MAFRSAMSSRSLDSAEALSESFMDALRSLTALFFLDSTVKRS